MLLSINVEDLCALEHILGDANANGTQTGRHQEALERIRKSIEATKSSLAVNGPLVADRRTA